MKMRLFASALLCTLLVSCSGDGGGSGESPLGNLGAEPTKELSDTTKDIVGDFLDFMFEGEVLAVPDSRPVASPVRSMPSDSSSSVNDSAEVSVNSSVKNTAVSSDATEQKILSWIETLSENDEANSSSKTITRTGTENGSGRTTWTNHESEFYPGTTIDGFIQVNKNSSNYSANAEVKRTFHDLARRYYGKSINFNGTVTRTLNGTITLIPPPPEQTEVIALDFTEKVKSMNITLSGDASGTLNSNIQVRVKGSFGDVSTDPFFECSGKFVYTNGDDVEVCNINSNCFGCL